MYERFTDRARKVMQLANLEAQRFNHEYIGTEHILLGLIKEGAGVAANVLKNLDIDLRKVCLEVEKIIQPGPDREAMDKLPQTPRTRKVVEYAIEEARDLHHNYVGTEHLLLGLLREEDCVGAQVLMNLGLRLPDVRVEVLSMLGHKIDTKEGCSGRNLVRRWSGSGGSAERAMRESRDDTARNNSPMAELRERIQVLEQQLVNVRIVLGVLAGALAGVLLAVPIAAVLGLSLFGGVAALGRRNLAALMGGVTGALLGADYLPNEGGGLTGVLLGALTGFAIAEFGGSTERRGGSGSWRRR